MEFLFLFWVLFLLLIKSFSFFLFASARPPCPGHRQQLSFKIGCFFYLTPLTLSKQLISTVLSKQTWNILCFPSSDDSLWWLADVTYDQYFRKQKEFEVRSSQLREKETFLLLNIIKNLLKKLTKNIRKNSEDFWLFFHS